MENGLSHIWIRKNETLVNMRKVENSCRSRIYRLNCENLIHLVSMQEVYLKTKCLLIHICEQENFSLHKGILWCILPIMFD